MNTQRAHFAVDFHVHTSFSFDCLMPPKLVINAARRKGLNGIAITDHDTVEGARATVDANLYTDLLVIPGIEVKSDLGDIIGLYVQRQIKSRRFADVIEEIHEQGGVAYLPHPIRTFGGRRTKQIHADHPGIDLWEKYNGRYSREDLRQSGEVFEELGITSPLCGSDAHFPWEVGVFRTLLADRPRDARALLTLSNGAKLDAPLRGEITVRIGHNLGDITKAIKRRDSAKLASTLGELPFRTIQRLARTVARRTR